MSPKKKVTEEQLSALGLYLIVGRGGGRGTFTLIKGRDESVSLAYSSLGHLWESCQGSASG